MRNLKIGTFGGVVSTQRGDVIAIFNQSAYHPGGKSILSCLQVEDNGITVHDKLIPHGGRQCIETPDGYIRNPLQVTLVSPCCCITRVV